MVASVSSGTSIDVNTLVSQLMAAERSPLTAIQKQASDYQTQISAFGQLQSTLSGLGDALAALDAGTPFRAAGATVSDTSILTASAANGTQAATYSVEVQALAQAQKLSSASVASSSATMGSGTLTLQLGSFSGGVFTPNAAKGALTLTVDASNNTLAGIRDAINAGNAGVRASIINDGTGARLSVSAVDGGTANSLKISVTDGDGSDTDTAGLSRLAFDPAAGAGSGRNLTQNVAAQDALLYIDGVKVVKSSNTVTDAIDGVTLNLAKINTGSTVAVTVAPDTAAMKTALDGFVKAYNSFNTTYRNLTYYDAANKKAGTLQGDATARGLQAQVRSIVTSAVPGLTGALTRLSDVGIALQSDGSLALNASRFQAAVSAHPADVVALFSTVGQSTDTRVSFAGASGTASAGSFAVNVTQAATQGRLTGGAAAALTIAAGVNDTLSVSIDGQAVSVTLAAGTYASADALAAEIQSRLNGAPALTSNGISARVAQSGGVLGITSSSYGSASVVSGLGGNAANGLFGSATASAGVDVAGTINGIAASGSGQSLASADGLRLLVNAQGTGAMGSVTLTRGYGTLLHNAVTRLTNSGGPISARTDGLNASIKRNTKQQDDFNTRMTTLEAQYRRQYSALDSMLTSMNSTLNYVTQQLSSTRSN